MEYMSRRRSLIVYLLMLAAPGIGMPINETLGATILLMAISSYVMLVFLHESALAHARAMRACNQVPTMHLGFR